MKLVGIRYTKARSMSSTGSTPSHQTKVIVSGTVTTATVRQLRVKSSTSSSTTMVLTMLAIVSQKSV